MKSCSCAGSWDTVCLHQLTMQVQLFASVSVCNKYPLTLVILFTPVFFHVHFTRKITMSCYELSETFSHTYPLLGQRVSGLIFYPSYLSLPQTSFSSLSALCHGNQRNKSTKRQQRQHEEVNTMC